MKFFKCWRFNKAKCLIFHHSYKIYTVSVWEQHWLFFQAILSFGRGHNSPCRGLIHGFPGTSWFQCTVYHSEDRGRPHTEHTHLYTAVKDSLVVSLFLLFSFLLCAFKVMFFKYDENKWGMKNLFCNVYLINLSTNDIRVYELLYCTIEWQPL